MPLNWSQLIRPTAFLAFFSMFGFVCTEIIVTPKDVDALLGTSVTFNCSSSIQGTDVQWVHYPNGKGVQGLYAYGKVSSLYTNRFTVIDGHNLRISSVTAGDAGKFECQEDYGQGEKHSAELIVLESNPVCRSSSSLHRIVGKNICGIEPSNVTLSCIIQFHGNKAPTMEWKKNGDEKLITSDVRNVIEGNLVIHNLTLRGDSIVNGSSFSCRPANAQSASVTCDSGTVTTTGKSTATYQCESCKNYVAAIITICVIIFGLAGILVTWFLKKKKIIQKDESTRRYLYIRGQGIEEHKGQHEFSPEGVELENKPNCDELEREPINQKIAKDQQKIIENLRQETEQKDSTTMKQEKYEELEKENKHLMERCKSLEEKIRYLERHLYSAENVNYFTTPSLIQEINMKSTIPNVTTINGLAVVGNDLFVLRWRSSEIEVYDCESYRFRDKLLIPYIIETIDLTASIVDKCLYILGFVDAWKRESVIVRIDVSGKLLDPWSVPSGGVYGKLSTYESNLVVCLREKKIIKEFSRDGKEVLTVPLLSPAGMACPLHAIKVTSMHYVVSDGHKEGDLLRICVVDLDGSVSKECKEWDQRHLRPEHRGIVHSIQDNERTILAADQGDSQIFLLSSKLTYPKTLIQFSSDEFPRRFCFDEAQKRLFVAINRRHSDGRFKDARVLIYKIK